MEFKIFYISPSFTEEGIDNGGGRRGGWAPGGALAPGGGALAPGGIISLGKTPLEY